MLVLSVKPHLESHLIISVGESLYCAMAKGPLVNDHVLLIPIEHSPSTLSLAPAGQQELYRFQCSLRKFCKTQGKEVVFFEWITKRGTHANLQAIPFPQTKAYLLLRISSTWLPKDWGLNFRHLKMMMFLKQESFWYQSSMARLVSFMWSYLMEQYLDILLKKMRTSLSSLVVRFYLACSKSPIKPTGEIANLPKTKR